MVEPTEIRKSAAGLTLGDWENLLKSEGHPGFRAKQIVEWIFEKRVSDFSQMTNLSQALRDWLEARFFLNELETVSVTGSRDTTRKFL
ncbi:MAG: hypothetical protein P1V20_13005, partial [Verrucomicrobiales bacterium]|nr:hypothetical protein [Verrucomicrobiales bacterium]